MSLSYSVYIPSVQEQFQGENAIMKYATYAKKKKKNLLLNLEWGQGVACEF